VTKQPKAPPEQAAPDEVSDNYCGLYPEREHRWGYGSQMRCACGYVKAPRAAVVPLAEALRICQKADDDCASPGWIADELKRASVGSQEGASSASRHVRRPRAATSLPALLRAAPMRRG